MSKGAFITKAGLAALLGFSLTACGGGGSKDPELVVTPAGLERGEAGEEVEFEFLARNLPDDMRMAEFTWTLGDGADSAGTRDVAVENREAKMVFPYTYINNGMYGMTVTVEDPEGDFELSASYINTVGEPVIIEETLDICDVWKVGTAGGQGVTVANWDISAIPSGAKFDLRYDMFTIPDRAFVRYQGDLKTDTGWRGASSYEGLPQYPGGIAGPGQGESLDMFQKAGSDEFEVAIHGPDAGTAWRYEVRCRQ